MIEDYSIGCKTMDIKNYIDYIDNAVSKLDIKDLTEYQREQIIKKSLKI